MTDVRAVFADGGFELVVEALCKLRERKQEALLEASRHPATSTLTARDFGIPQIDTVLARLAATPTDSSRDEVNGQLLAPASGQIGIRLEGGAIQSVWADRPMDVVVIDYDAGDRPGEELFDMPQEDGRTSQCFVEEYAVSVMPEECQRIRAALDSRELRGPRP